VKDIPVNHGVRFTRARRSLEGLSVGDAFGEQFFIRGFEMRIEQRQTLRGPWYYTDDTEMGISICSVGRAMAGRSGRRILPEKENLQC